ncbi:hypothetical protein A245_46638, partial [Pseudomonas syringae pv. actinidiae ICMP 19096]
QKWGGDLSHRVNDLVALLRSDIGKVAAAEIKNVVINALRIPAALNNTFDSRVIAGFDAALHSRVENALFE